MAIIWVAPIEKNSPCPGQPPEQELTGAGNAVSVIVKRFLGRRPSLLHLLKALALVMPSACGPDEIYHLKESLSSILILTVILHFVKDFLVLQQSRPFFLVRQ